MNKAISKDRPALQITVLAASTMTVLAGAILAPALPSIEMEFANQENAAFWTRMILTFPALFIALNAPLAGILVDRVGRKPVLVASIALAGLAGGRPRV